ncbi:c-type cytochrome [Mucilaginibacter lacusdianchii]|uniref:c-type cytochrome n=1 Tax=Mucilaginibacter lacusdianchii TaxID=2684211 RepID=UPI0018EEF9A5|nr:c-type cytochrome [Mucilaginibacter sp. JXJ CY 39]
MKMKKPGKAILLILLVVLVVITSGLGYVRYFKPDVGAAPQIKIISNPQMIERGRYMANHVMSCIDCHSTRNFSEFAGPMVAGTAGKGGDRFGPEVGFPGTFYAPNITPAALKSWTDGELFRAITTGVRNNGEPIFPVMPYHYYGRADSADVIAVIAYLRTLPAIENEVPASKADFPVNFIMRTMPAKAHLQPKPDTANQLAYGKYLVSTAACQDCHTQVNKGELIAGLEFAGGRTFDLPTGKVSSSNLTPDATGIGSWTPEQFVSRFARFRTESATHQVVRAGEFNSIMPWTMYAGMTDKDIKAIFTYLKTLKPIKNQVVKFVPKG